MLGRNAFIVPDVLKVPIQGTRQVRPPAIHSRTMAKSSKGIPKGTMARATSRATSRTIPVGLRATQDSMGSRPQQDIQ